MITGNGLIAGSLAPIDRESCVFFCSGVSNSSEKLPAAFQRETDLLLNQDRTKKLIYFSTVSIFNPVKVNDPYIIHKKEIEKKIAEFFSDFLILRLPNLVGQGGNKTNLFPYFHQAILNNQNVVIRKNAKRHLLAANHLSAITNKLLSADLNGTLNVSIGPAPTVLDIYLYMCEQLNTAPNYTTGPEEAEYVYDSSAFEKLVQQWKMEDVFDWKSAVKTVLGSADQSSQF